MKNKTVSHWRRNLLLVNAVACNGGRCHLFCRVRHVIGGVHAEEHVVDEHYHHADPEADVRHGAQRAHEEEVGGHGRCRKPRHQRHTVHLGLPLLLRAQGHPRRAGRPDDAERDLPRPLPCLARVVVHRHPDGGEHDERQEEDECAQLRGRRGPDDVVSADEERHRDEREDEERADGGDGGERSRA
jgi:hypothetical protein